MKSITSGTLIIMLLACLMARPGAGDDTQRDARMAWWREARFGMFIHWGLYAVLGGEWQGFDHGTHAFMQMRFVTGLKVKTVRGG